MTPEIPPVAGLSPTLTLILTIAGALVPVISVFASILNASIRARTDKGETISPVALFFVGVLNFLAVNTDKTIQLLKMAKGIPVATTVSTPPVVAADATKPPVA